MGEIKFIFPLFYMKINEILNQEDLDKLLTQIDREYQEGFNYVVNKRNQYRDRVIRWNKQSKDINKININMIANATDTLILILID